MVLPDYTAFRRDGELEGAIYAVYPHRKHVSPKVRVFLDFMAEYIGDPPYWEEQWCSKLPSVGIGRGI
jgi:DNA-binding transcriptional LysR family regulator